MLKLAEVLYEAARTADDAINKNVAAFLSFGDLDAVTVVLMAADRTLQIAKRHEELLQSPTNSTADMKEMINQLQQRAVVGTVDGNKVDDELWKVNSSAAVNSFGPLAYQMVMFTINPGWLKSDKSLTSASQNVWNKMYELSEKGVYERKWLGDFDSGHEWLEQAARGQLNPNGTSEFGKESVGFDPRTEEAFMAELKNRNLPVTQFGNFWAYRPVKHDPNVIKVFDAGDVLRQRLLQFGLTNRQVNFVIADAGERFFLRMYKR